MVKAEREIFYKQVCNDFLIKNRSVKEIAADYNVKTMNIYRILKQNNIDVSKQENRFNNAILKDYQKGMRIKDLAIKYNKAQAQISALITKHNLERRGKPLDEQKKMYKNIIHLLSKGYTQSDIAKKYNVSRQYISKVYKKFREDKESE